MKNYDKLIQQFGTPKEGAPKPYDYVVEECAELIQAIQHYKRGRADSLIHMINEMADVYTLMDATRFHLGIPFSEIEFFQQKLIDRYLGLPNDGRHVD